MGEVITFSRHDKALFQMVREGGSITIKASIKPPSDPDLDMIEMIEEMENLEASIGARFISLSRVHSNGDVKIFAFFNLTARDLSAAKAGIGRLKNDERILKVRPATVRQMRQIADDLAAS